MIRALTIASLLIALAGAAPAWADKLYKWVDENGVVHYGDAVPARYSSGERHVINKQGVTVEIKQRVRTAEELEAERLRLEVEEKARMEAMLQKRRDKILLDTYLSEEEILMLRDRRLLALDAQIGLIQHFMQGKEKEWAALIEDAKKYNFPHEQGSDLPDLPEDLAKLIISTEAALAEHSQSIQSLRYQKDKIRTEFEDDRLRFLELKAARP